MIRSLIQKKVNFYSSKDLNKICDLNISDFNSENCKYTTLKRSDLVNFLKKGVEDLIKLNHNVSRINKQNQGIQIGFENNENFECDYLIISDGVFSKSKNLIYNNKNQPRYNNTLAIRGMMSNSSKIDYENISLFLGPDFHQVIYPVNQNGDLNFIAIMKYELALEEQKNYSIWAIGKASVKEIEKMNILQASLLAMERAIKKLKKKPKLILIDGNKTPNLKNHKLQSVIKGDQKIPSISAASIIAKVTRDKMISKLGQKFKNYYWGKNYGYGTKQHLAAIKKFGFTSHHRRTFSPISKIK